MKLKTIKQISKEAQDGWNPSYCDKAACENCSFCELEPCPIANAKGVKEVGWVDGYGTHMIGTPKGAAVQIFAMEDHK